MRWTEANGGWRAELEDDLLLLVKRAHRGAGWVWQMHARSADDDSWGSQPTDASAKHVAEKAYRAYRARRIL